MYPVGIIPTKPFSVFVFLYDDHVNDCISRDEGVYFSRIKNQTGSRILCFKTRAYHDQFVLWKVENQWL